MQRGPHLLSREPSWVGDVLADALATDGVDVRRGDPATAVEEHDGWRLRLESGALVPFDRLFVATGRAPVTDGLGLDEEWLEESGHVRTNARCRVVDASGTVVEGLFAVGDVTGLAPYTHTANHMARVVLAGLARGPGAAAAGLVPAGQGAGRPAPSPSSGEAQR